MDSHRLALLAESQGSQKEVCCPLSAFHCLRAVISLPLCQPFTAFVPSFHCLSSIFQSRAKAARSLGSSAHSVTLDHTRASFNEGFLVASSSMGLQRTNTTCSSVGHEHEVVQTTNAVLAGDARGEQAVLRRRPTVGRPRQVRPPAPRSKTPSKTPPCNSHRPNPRSRPHQPPPTSRPHRRQLLCSHLGGGWGGIPWPR